MRTYPVRSRARFLAIAIAGVLAAASVASAAEPTPPAPSAADVQKRLKELEEQVDRLNHETRQHEAAIENQTRFPLAQWKDGFYINSADNRFKLRIGAYTQADGRFFINDSADSNTSQFLFRRARLDIQGTVFRYFDFRILPDFAGANFTLFDAYVDYTQFPFAKLRVGKYKPPVGLERLQSATALMLVERGQPTNLVPNRDNGAMLYADLWDAAFSYQLGIDNGVPDSGNANGDVNDDKDFVGRIFAHPFRPFDIAPLRDLGFGLSGSYGHSSGTSTVSGTSAPSNNTDLPSYKSFGQATVFAYSAGAAGVPATTTCDDNHVCTTTPAVPGTAAAVAAGTRSRISPQGYFYYGPFKLLGEYVSSWQGVRRPGPTKPVPTHVLDNKAYQVAASYVITGEPASFTGVSPFQPFDPVEGKWGAFEVVARWGELDIDRQAFSYGFANPLTQVRRVVEYAGGVNWYLNKSIKLSLDFALSDFAGGAGTAKAPANRKSEQVIVERVQLAF
jgi:phosphate-selective porin OprO/OprP